MHKRVTGIVDGALTDHGKALAGSTPKHDSYILGTYARYAADVSAADIEYAAADRCAIGEIKLVDCAMDRIDINRGRDVKTGGLKTEAETSGTGKQVDPYRSSAGFLYLSC